MISTMISQPRNERGEQRVCGIFFNIVAKTVRARMFFVSDCFANVAHGYESSHWELPK